ncbi:zona pellucida sperm-binding protein 3 [Sorex fumeus]|uniref:zona pellucida sperm-binding protein 3 n=1 Tax=Sorex fumeus TaxID=62283 RepID=UPI0024ADBD42|nr:zona pellucida sperm-binding protein 3 [Sorex fumeus]
MELSFEFFVPFLLWGGAGLWSPQLVWGGPVGRALLGAHPVEVSCQESQLAITVSRDLFGTGKLIRPQDITLGPGLCRPALALEEEIRFEVGLHECGNKLQVTPDALVYRTFLLHIPRPSGNLSILRTSPARIPLECRYPRHGNVSSRAILPTWVPFHTTVSSSEKLVFSLHLMEDDWSGEKQMPTFQLGDRAHLEARVHAGSHVPLRLFVDSCVATPTADQHASPSHTIVDLHGCLVDGLSDASSAFHTPRPAPERLRFSVDVFYFANDSRNTVYITCHLKVAPVDHGPNAQHKACSFNKASGSWYPVEGTEDICDCCSAGDCGIPETPKNVSQWLPVNVSQSTWQRDWGEHNPRARRHVTEEADVTVGPLIFLGKAGDRGVEDLALQGPLALALGLAAVASVSLAVVVLSLARRTRPTLPAVMCPDSAL